MFIRRKAPVLIDRVLISALVLVAATSAARDYEDFALPRKVPKAVAGESKFAFSSSRVQFRGRSRLKEPGVDAREYLFAREQFLAEKRDQAIKLLRQELDSGGKSNRDNVLLRLGQLYAEKYMELSFREHELYARESEEFQARKDKPTSAKPPELDNSRSKKYLGDSVGLFKSLEKQYPKHPKMDEIVYFIGFVESELGKPETGVKYLERVIRQYPRSQKFEEAVIYLADHLFEKQRYRDSYAKYSILVARPRSDLHHYARYKMAWCELNTTESRKALGSMKLLVDSLRDNEDKAKFNLREQALKDLVLFFAEAEAVEDATSYFTDRIGREKALENLKLIADILRSKARDAAAVRAYGRLLKEYPDSLEAPQMELGMFESLVRLGKTGAAVERLAAAVERYGASSDWARGLPEEKRQGLKAVLATLQTEAEKAALLQHQSAQKSQNKQAYVYALRLYDALVKGFPDHPGRKNISFYRGEILFQQGKWLESADSYMDAAKIAPKDKVTDESVYNALLALEKLTERNNSLERFSKDQQKTVGTERQEIPAGEKRFIEVAEYYLREYPRGQRVVDVRFRIGSIYYRYHHFDEALDRFKELATKHPGHRAATTSAHISLDILNIQKKYDAMNELAGVFAATRGLGDAAFRKEMAQIATEVGFKRVEALEGEQKWKEAAEAYVRIYRADPGGALAEKALYNAHVGYEKAGEWGRAAETSKLFVEKFPKSEFTRRLVLARGKAAEKVYDLDLAFSVYRDYWRRYPKEKDARSALFNAAVFAEVLEKTKEAISLYEDYLKGPVTQDERGTIWLSLAKLHRKAGAWDKSNLYYRRLMREAPSTGAKIELLAEMVRQHERAGRKKEREELLKEIRWMADKGTKLDGQGVSYVAEARFSALDGQRKKYQEVILRFPPEDLLYLMKRKTRLLSKLADAYDQVIDLGVPDWGVAALNDKAEAYEHFVTAYRAVVIPKSIKGDLRTETEASLKKIDETQVKPLEAKAAEVRKACLERAAQFRVANDYAARCRVRGKPDDGPRGLWPAPNYWSIRVPSNEVASR